MHQAVVKLEEIISAAAAIISDSASDQKGYNSMKYIGSAGSATGSMKKILSKVVRTSING